MTAPRCRAKARPAVAALTLAWLTAALAPAAAQPCDGIDLEVGAGALRCLRPGAAQPFRDCPHCPEMVVVPAGRFTMGTPADEEIAGPREDQVEVRIAVPFAVARFAVTRGEFAAFVRATGHQTVGGCFRLVESQWKRQADVDWRAPGFPQDDGHPAVCVNWHDAQAYAAWIAALTGKRYRLLSEAEREYATRAGSTTPFWWGTTVSTDQANFDGRVAYAGGARGALRGATLPVDSFAANPWGLYNVHGNVWEWTQDCWNQTNAGNPGDGTARMTGDCSLRVLRGASWHNYPHTIRSGRRGMEPLGNRDAHIGFRLVRAL